MALPKALTSFTSPILDKALETGARGSTTTNTNYGVIGDAFFKKAQLELGVANLQADFGIKKATLLSGLEMDRANLELRKSEVINNAAMQAAELRMQAEADDVSDMEMIMGTLGGAASGAAAGFAVGGPVGAVVGGVAGGGIAAAGYSQGRPQGQMALQTVGLISGAATSMKEYSDVKKKEDGFKNVMDGINTAKGFMDSATNKQDFEAAQAVYQQQVQGAAAGLAKAGFGPEETATFMTSIHAGNKGIYSSDPTEYNTAKIDKFGQLMRTDKALQSGDPSVQQGRLKEYLGGAESSMAIINKYDPTKVMTQGVAQSYADAHGVGGIAQDMFNPKTPVVRTSVAASQPAIKAAAPSAAPQRQPQVASPAATQDSGDIRQTSFQSQGNPMEGGIPFAPAPTQIPMASGVKMDDGMDMFTKPVAAEQKMAEMGAQTLEKLRLNPEKDAKGNVLTSREMQNGVKTPVNEGDSTQPSSAQFVREQQDAYVKEMEPEKQVFFTETKDPRKIQKAMGMDKLKYLTPEQEETASATASAAVIQNKLKEESLEFKSLMDEAGFTPEEQRDLMQQMQLHRFGMGGMEGNMNMEGKGGGASVGKIGIGAQFQSFKKNFEMQLEKKGVRPNVSSKILAKWNGIETRANMLAGTVAKGNLGGQLSNVDLAMHQAINVLDPNPDIFLNAMNTQQEDLYSRLQSRIGLRETKEEFRQTKMMEGQAGRKSQSEELETFQMKEALKLQNKQPDSWRKNLGQEYEITQPGRY